VIVDDRYLGDGVYASFDGYHIWLETRGSDNPQRIALEEDVYRALVGFNKDLQEALHDRP